MACERCGKSDAPTEEYVLEKGGGTMRREFCDTCRDITAEVYPLTPVRPGRPRRRRAKSPEPATEAAADPEALAEEPEGQEPKPAEEPEGQEPEPAEEAEEAEAAADPEAPAE